MTRGINYDILDLLRHRFITTGLVTIVPTSQAEGWAENWKSKLGELWGETKEKAQKGWEAVTSPKPIEIGIAPLVKGEVKCLT